MNVDPNPTPGDLALAGLRGLDLQGRPDPAHAAQSLRRALLLVARTVIRRAREEDLEDIASAAWFRVWPTSGFKGQSPGEAFQYLRRVVWSAFVDQRDVLQSIATDATADTPDAVVCAPIGPTVLDPQDAADAREFLAHLARVRVKLLLLAAQDARPSRPGPYVPLRFFLDECLALSNTPASPVPASGAEASTWRYRGLRSARALVEKHAAEFADDGDVLAAIFHDAPPQGQNETPRDVSAGEELK